MNYIVVILIFSIIFLNVGDGKMKDAFFKKEIEREKIQVKNELTGNNDIEVGALRNKRLYNDLMKSDLSQDIQYTTGNEYNNFIKEDSMRDFLGTSENGEGIVGTAVGNKGLDFNVSNTTDRVLISEGNEKLNKYTSNVYDIVLNSNFNAIGDKNEELFRKILIRWGEPSDNVDIQISLHRFDIQDAVSFKAEEMLEEFYKESNDSTKYKKDLFIKKIFLTTDSEVKSSLDYRDDPQSGNPQSSKFANAIKINDLISNTDFEPKKYLYYLTFETLSNEAVPIMIEAYNGNNERVGFVGDYTLTFDSYGIGNGNKSRMQLIQTVGAGKKKYFSKSLFGGSNITKSDAK